MATGARLIRTCRYIETSDNARPKDKAFNLAFYWGIFSVR